MVVFVVPYRHRKLKENNGFFNVCGLYFRVTKIRKSTGKFKHYKIINVHRRYMTQKYHMIYVNLVWGSFSVV